MPGAAAGYAAPAGSGACASESQLRRELYSALKGSGVVSRLKCTLRAELVSRLRGHERERGWLTDADAPVPPPLQRRIVDSLFVDYLRARGLEYTLAVFLPECGLPAEHALPREDMVSLLGKQAAAADALAEQQANSAGGGAMVAHSTGGGNNGGAKVLPDRSLATCLVHAMHRQYVAAGDAATQTDALAGGGRVERELEAVERMYEAKMAAEAMVPFAALEQRMAEYQNEVDRRAKEEIRAGIERVRQVELGTARLEEAAAQRRVLEARREDLDRVAADRLKTLHEREEAAADRLKRKERELEAKAAEHRAHLTAELERLRARDEDMARAAQMQRELHEAERARVAQREEAAQRREADAERAVGAAKAEASVVAMRNRAEMERDFANRASAIQLDRAQLDAEMARFNAVKEAHASEIASTRADREALLECQEELAAARGCIKQQQERRDDARAEGASHGGGGGNGGPSDARLALLAKEVSAVNQALVAEQQAVLQERQKRKAAKAAFGAERDALKAEMARYRQAAAVWKQERDAWERRLESARAATSAAEQQTKLVYDQKEELTRRLEELRLDLAAAQRDLESGRNNATAAYAAHVAQAGSVVATGPAFAAANRAPSPAAGAAAASAGATDAQESQQASQQLPSAARPAQRTPFTGILSRLEKLEAQERGGPITSQEFRARLDATRRRTDELREGAARDMAGSVIDQLRYALADEGVAHGEPDEETLSDDIGGVALPAPAVEAAAAAPAAAQPSVTNVFFVGEGAGAAAALAPAPVVTASAARAPPPVAAALPTATARTASPAPQPMPKPETAPTPAPAAAVTSPVRASRTAPSASAPLSPAGGLPSPTRKAGLPPLRPAASPPKPAVAAPTVKPEPAAARTPVRAPAPAPAASPVPEPEQRPIAPAPAAPPAAAFGSRSSSDPSEIATESVPSIASESIGFDEEVASIGGMSFGGGSAELSVGGGSGSAHGLGLGGDDSVPTEDPYVDDIDEPLDDIGVSPARSDESEW